jgi:23S rRNA (uracil1939-C5)-methyltransferase
MKFSLATVSDLNSEGWGVVRTEAGEVVFVPGAWPGDQIEFSIQSRGKFSLGKLEKIITKSSAHRENNCPSRDAQTQRCVACPWVGIHYSKQLEAKNKRLNSLMKRFKVQPKETFPILPSPQEFHYRNRVKLHQENYQLGYKDPISLKFTPVSECLAVEEWINLEIKNFKNREPSESKEIWIQKGNAGEFNQGNSGQNAQIKEILKKELKTFPKSSFLELFCGSGNFSEVIQEFSTTLACIEGNEEALEKIKVQIKLKNWTNTETSCLNLYSNKSLSKIIQKNSGAERLFLDPPRSGYKDLCHLVDKMPDLKSIFYLSCDPMTFFRDISKLSSQWSFEKLYSFDMFPHTPHIEVMGVFQYNESL